jgi:hypothetical protein
MKSWVTPQAFCIWLRYTPLEEVNQATLSLVVLDKFESWSTARAWSWNSIATQESGLISETAQILCFDFGQKAEKHYLAEIRIGADIYLLLVTYKNVEWHTLKFI